MDEFVCLCVCLDEFVCLFGWVCVFVWMSLCGLFGWVCVFVWMSLCVCLDEFVCLFGWVCVFVWMSLCVCLDEFVCLIGWVCVFVWMSLCVCLDEFVCLIGWVCVFVWMSLCVCLDEFVCLFGWVCVFVWMSLCVCLDEFVCLFGWVCVFVWMSLCVCLDEFVCLFGWVCVFDSHSIHSIHSVSSHLLCKWTSFIFIFRSYEAYSTGTPIVNDWTIAQNHSFIVVTSSTHSFHLLIHGFTIHACLTFCKMVDCQRVPNVFNIHIHLIIMINQRLNESPQSAMSIHMNSSDLLLYKFNNNGLFRWSKFTEFWKHKKCCCYASGVINKYINQ